MCGLVAAATVTEGCSLQHVGVAAALAQGGAAHLRIIAPRRMVGPEAEVGLCEGFVSSNQQRPS